MSDTDLINEPKRLTVQQQIDKDILSQLELLAGGRVSDDSLNFRGTEFVIPESMTTTDAIHFLRNYQSTQEKVMEFSRTFNYRPWDGAAALARALKKVTGNAAIAQSTFSFFGENKPELRTINIGPNETLQVPWGMFSIPMWGDEGSLYTTASLHPDFGLVFAVQVQAPRKHQKSVEGLFQAIEAELRTESIYRGRAIDGQTNAQFLDLRAIDSDRIVYSDDVITQLNANVWSVLEHSTTLRELGVPLKRAVLLEGPYGTGKTLGAFLTAKKAEENGWTFIYCRPGKDDLQETLATARLYQPSVVFFEDVDTVSSSGDDDAVTRLLDMFDGIQAKGTEIMAILTTNHAERIHKGMVRPGRLDAIIHIGALDAPGVQRMIESVVPEHLLGHYDIDPIYAAMEGYMPAFVKEAVERAVRYNMARNKGVPTVLETQDFVDAANGLRAQFDLMQAAQEGTHKPALEVAYGAALEDAVRDVLDRTKMVDRDGDETGYGAYFNVGEKPHGVTSRA